jgi:RNA polymerase sigma factor (sigma-70 family)
MCEISQSRKESDLEKAQRICQQIQKHGNKAAVVELYEQYHDFFIAFARMRLYDPANAEDVVSAFWVELLNGNAICGYKAINNASLKTFLSRILRWRIINANHNRYEIMPPPPPDIVHDIQEEIIKKMVHRGLKQLETVNPRCAKLIRLYLKGLSHKEKAIEVLGSKPYTDIELEREINKIKHEINNKGTGSCQKQLSRIINREMHLRKLILHEFFTR